MCAEYGHYAWHNGKVNPQHLRITWRRIWKMNGKLGVTRIMYGLIGLVLNFLHDPTYPTPWQSWKFSIKVRSSSIFNMGMPEGTDCLDVAGILQGF